MKISMIAAIGKKNRVLGKNNKLIWNIPEDTKRFRDITKGHIVIMGRKTYDSMGRLLPHRTNIIITRDKTFHLQDAIICYSIEEALVKAKELTSRNKSSQYDVLDEVFIIGGGQIYKEGLAFTDKLYLTLIEGDFEGDAFFPEYSIFKKVVYERKSEENGYKYIFIDLEKE